MRNKRQQIGLMNQIEYLTNHLQRHRLFSTIFHIHPHKLKSSSKNHQQNNTKTKITEETEPLQKRSKTIEIVPPKQQEQEENSQKHIKIFHNQVSISKTFKIILNEGIRISTRIQKVQLLKYLNKYYCSLIIDQLCRIFKFCDTLSLRMYEEFVQSIHSLDKVQYLNICFNIYDLNNGGAITSTNLLTLLTQEHNTAIETDILEMINSNQTILKSQFENNFGCKLPKLRTIEINHKRTYKKKIMISQIEDEINQVVIQPINRLKLIDKLQFNKIWSEKIPSILEDLLSHLIDY